MGVCVCRCVCVCMLVWSHITDHQKQCPAMAGGASVLRVDTLLTFSVRVYVVVVGCAGEIARV